MMGLEGGEEILGVQKGTSLAAPLIFFIAIVFQLLSAWLERLKKTASMSASQVQLRAEIKQLLKEATSLSQPSTFAQAAKLRRLAAAKEKELAKCKELNSKEMSYDSYLKILFISKVVVYLVLICWFWRTPVAVVSQQLVQPLGKVLSWSAAGHLDNNIMVGILPWLTVSTRVSKFVGRLIK